MNNKTKDYPVFTCEDCKKEKNAVTDRIDPEIDVCNDCLAGCYDNKTGYCSAYCITSGVCDGSC